MARKHMAVHARSSATRGTTQIAGCPSCKTLESLVIANPPRTENLCSALLGACSRFEARRAVRVRSECLRYGELASWSQEISRRIEATGTSGPIALPVRNELWVIAGLMGILSTGRTCLPLALDHSSRSDSILEESGCDLVIQGGEREARGARASLKVDDLRGGDSPSWSAIELGGDASIVLLPTSGSSGSPKTVVQTGDNLLFAARRWVEAGALEASDRTAILFSLGLAAPLVNLIATFLTGGEAHLISLRDLGISRIAQELKEGRISVLPSVPSVLRSLASETRCLESLRLVKLSGERVMPGDIASARRLGNREVKVCAALGSTEVLWICHRLFEPGDEVSGSCVPLGLPPKQVEIRIDDGGRCEEGGEIVVRSRFVSPGYWQGGHLFEDRHRKAVDGASDGLRTFRTGDKGRWLEDGALVWLDRLDRQVQIHGLRVEPAEIESCLLAFPKVRDAAVVAVSFGASSQLVALFTGEAGETELRRHLVLSLPSAMVPIRVRRVDRLPRLPSGKVDSRRVESEAEGVTEEGIDLGPSVEKIWRDVLGSHSSSFNLTFQDLGGDSLLALTLIDRIRDELGVQISPAILNGPLDPDRLLAEVERERSIASEGMWRRLSQGPGPALLVFPGIGNRSEPFLSLLDLLGASHEIWVADLDEAKIDEESELSGVADAFLEGLDLRDESPIAILGYSFGGRLAFEMASSRLARGGALGLLSMFDTRAPGFRISKAFRVLGLLRDLARSEKGPRVELQRRFEQRRRQQELRGGGPPPGPEAATMRARLRAADHQRGASYPGRLLLFRSRDRTPSQDPTLGWNRFVEGGIDLVALPGDHASSLHSPSVEVLATELESRWQRDD